MTLHSVRVEWPAATFGTPPYVTSFDVDGDPQTSLEDIADYVQNAWNLHLPAVLSTNLGPGTMYVRKEVGGEIFETTRPTIAPSASGSLLTGGASYRIKKVSQRTKTGRQGSMYIPGVRLSQVNTENGAFTAGALSAWENALGGFKNELDLPGGEASLVQVHKRGTPQEALFRITELVLAPTVSFMRKRYR